MRIQKLLPIVALIFAAGISWGEPSPVSSASLTLEGVKVHPVMSMTPDDVKLGRENYATRPWAKPIGDSITSAANVWLERDGEWIRKHMPGPAACFAYGFAGCPECGGKTGYWNAAICSFEDPGQVKCVNGHSLPNEKYPDAGKGYSAKDGRIHYFVGTYNAWAIEEFQTGAYNLAYAYSLTGDDRYAACCAEILDALADIYPTCTIGSWDYPETRPNSNEGRFNRPFYQVGRVLITLSDTYDQVFHSPAMQQASIRTGMTRQQNIERNMLLNGADYCYKKSFGFSGLTNGSADYIKGAMVVGLVLGIPEYVTWAVDGPYGIRTMLANNIGRDGTYYETATGYAYYTRAIYRGYAEYLLNYRGSAYPNGVNLYEDSRFCNFMLLHDLRTQVGGMMPSYGDHAPYGDPAELKDQLFDKFDFECLSYLMERTTSAEKKKEYAGLLSWMTQGKVEDYYEKSSSSRWLLFHAHPNPDLSKPSDGGPLGQELKASDVLGQKGQAMLRTGEGKDAQGLFLRYGPSLNHSNFDVLNFSYYAMGHDLTYDLGYALASSHVYAGWSKQTASHQLTVVDEKSQGAGQAESGGSLEGFWQGEHTSAVTASDLGSYKNLGVKDYKRTLMLVGDANSTAAYALDIFHVRGGSKHDNFTHSLGKNAEFGNVDKGQITSSSLAGGDMIWGDKILVDGDVAGQPNKPYWVGPPGNGYGFLVEPQDLRPNSSAWWADWSIPESSHHLRVWFPSVKAEKALTAWGPGILKNLPDARYVVRRREPGAEGDNTFVSLWEPYADKPVVTGIEMVGLSQDKSLPGAVAVKVHRADGRTDLLFASPDSGVRSTGDMSVAGRYARLTLNRDKVEVAEGLALSKLMVAGKDIIQPGSPTVLTGEAVVVDPDEGVIETKTQLPLAVDLKGKVISFRNPGYTRNTAYKVASVDRLATGSVIRLTESCNLGRGVVSDVSKTSSSVVTLVSHEYAKTVIRNADSGFFRGKRIRTDKGAMSTIRRIDIKQPMTLYVESIQGISKGDTFVYDDVQPGDNWEILLPAKAQL